MAPAEARRPWDAPAQQLNEIGPGGYNYFNRWPQVDDLRRWHAGQLEQSKRSPLLRAKEDVQYLNSEMRYTPSSVTGRYANGRMLPSRAAAAEDWAKEQARLSKRSAATPQAPAFTPDRRPRTAGALRCLPMPKALLLQRPSMAELMHTHQVEAWSENYHAVGQ